MPTLSQLKNGSLCVDGVTRGNAEKVQAMGFLVLPREVHSSCMQTRDPNCNSPIAFGVHRQLAYDGTVARVLYSTGENELFILLASAAVYSSPATCAIDHMHVNRPSPYHMLPSSYYCNEVFHLPTVLKVYPHSSTALDSSRRPSAESILRKSVTRKTNNRYLGFRHDVVV